MQAIIYQVIMHKTSKAAIKEVGSHFLLATSHFNGICERVSKRFFLAVYLEVVELRLLLQPNEAHWRTEAFICLFPSVA